MVRTSNDAADRCVGREELSDRDRHELLAADRRRVALAILAEYTEPFGIDELAVAVANREAELETDDEERPSVERVALTLHHAHLPWLADAGVIEYEPESRRIDSGNFSLESLRRN
ncbi:hypothetical protein C491_10489 [Natronococcus amylolyticus DSM 10524]|uniref:DUF7344 domain-containing protein n=1 Tax=Natronococcus amylolyticus DSM 10524 TaxID=1227497 RepID=L9X9D3_9EURY|nr:hypothetical protein [Natronococcus amylolyticus]ELY58217.1 hypothetical protein C491_10489 [Natronococcus amylolyticus DSM 10524]